MANIKSAKKRILQSEKKAVYNKQRKSSLRSLVKNINTSIDKKNSGDAEKLFIKLEPALSKSVRAGLFKKNTVSRTLSRISKKIKLLK
ncbi:MAG: 30S ribosomal protein S20 [Rickettsiales bacterium]|nr:30S ribosomal protein S20 [Rickettsiales bacterium]OUV54054.1 MAG: 30S ribosomal protein S20 [Rickettsiales bacterium TMED127]|tara:strand:- start:31794 stop:32057 length:264 start_codon:yes stop_codon:yes gene_type:complete